MSNKSKYFTEGKIKPEFISNLISELGKNLNSGGHFFFLGQVRNDLKDGNEVKSLLYTSYEEMAERIFGQIENETLNRYKNLDRLEIRHSLGNIKAGEISFLVFASSKHRKNIFEAVELTVERIKKEVPIWKKEIF